MLPSKTKFDSEMAEISIFISSIEAYEELLKTNFTKTRVPYKHLLLKAQYSMKDCNKRKFDYSTIIINLYGAFEQYIEGVVIDYLSILCNLVDSYANLPLKLKENHFELSTNLLKLVDQQKYMDIITPEQIIKNLYSCIQDKEYRMNFLAFSQHTSNFRINTIKEVLHRLLLTDILKDIMLEKEMKDYYKIDHDVLDYDQLPLDKVFEKVNALADRRNEISHGSINDILSLSDQKDHLYFMRLFVKCMDKAIFKKLLPHYSKNCYKITNTISPRSKVLCFRIKDYGIKVGDIVIIKNLEQNTFDYDTIHSIQINGVSHDEIESDLEIDIGIMLTKNVSIDNEHWLYQFS